MSNTSSNDLIYLLCNRNRTEEKFEIFIKPTVKTAKQSIVFTPHVSTIYYEVKQLKKQKINCAAYTSNVEFSERDAIRMKFIENEIQFLYATPVMYFRNYHFRNFVNNQVLHGNLEFIVFDDAKFLFEYENDTSRYKSYRNFVKLKDFARNQRWIVLADAEVEARLGEVASFLHLKDPKVMEIKFRGKKGVKHEYQYSFTEVCCENISIVY